jgi:chromosome segregation protein
MLIKRVVIQGFKTFAKRTEFIFDPGVTAIVGPNGSGKSNVVDAIRWCLGEQSFSLLRSKKTSDIIFSGSDQKARLGMAQVTLTLDNSAGDLPLDFTEVEICRRAYRDGDNEYILNGQRVRLQDVTDLLAQTGLGRRTYALIGQGLIDKVLSLAPEELRGLFEEAAGITGYQAKRATTVRRLDAAQQNLVRVQDIVGELGPRLGTLRRQAERAREREQVAADLRSLLREWYGYHWHATLRELERSRDAAAALAQTVAADQTQVQTLAAQIATTRSQQTEIRAALGGLHRDSSRFHRDAEQIGRELAVGQERLRQLSARREEASRELAPRRLQQQSLSDRLTDLGRLTLAAEAALQERRAAVAAVQTQIDQRRQERLETQAAVTSARQHAEHRRAVATDASGRLRQTEEQLASLAKELDGAKTQFAAAVADVERRTALLAREQQTLAAAARGVATARQTLADHEAARESLRKVLASRQQEQREAERELDHRQTRHDLLARLQREGAGYAAGVRSVLQAGCGAGKPALAGILGTVASLVRVPAHLDKALETALGAAYQNVITRRWADTQAAIDYLKRTGNGRATFLPLDRLNTLPVIAAPKLPGVLGNAVDLVEFDAEITAAVAQLLNRVWVVDSLDTARAALDSLAGGPRPAVVTLDGEIVRPGGAVTGGSDGTRRDDSVLARERELRELPAQLAADAAKVAAAAQACRAVEAELAACAQVVAAAQSDLAASQQAERAAATRVEDARRSADRAQQSERWRHERLAALAAELDDAAARRTQLQTDLAVLTEQAADAGRRLEETEQALAAAGADDVLSALADHSAAAAVAEAAWQNLRGQSETAQRSLAATVDQITAKEQQIAQFAREAAGLTARLEELSGHEAELSAAIATLQAAITPGEGQLEELERNQAAQEQEERQLQETLRRNESAWNAAQLQHQRTDDRLRQLRHDIEQDLGLVLLDIVDDLAYQPPLPWETIVEQLPRRDQLAEELEEEVRILRGRLSRVTNVNPDAPREYAEAVARHGHLLEQSADLEAAIAGLHKILRELDEVMKAELSRTFGAVAEQFTHFFERLFSGGTAKLVLADPDDIANSGIEIVARPPGKRPQSLALLSGGERTLAALALIFAILRVSPTPFCVLDEVDAALDEANVDRFRQTVTLLSEETQFILITHNRRTLEGTNAMYGVTIAGDGTSRVMSLRLDGDRIVHGSEQAQDAAPGDRSDADMSAINDLVQM